MWSLKAFQNMTINFRCIVQKYISTKNGNLSGHKVCRYIDMEKMIQDIVCAKKKKTV